MPNLMLFGMEAVQKHQGPTQVIQVRWGQVHGSSAILGYIKGIKICTEIVTIFVIKCQKSKGIYVIHKHITIPGERSPGVKR